MQGTMGSSSSMVGAVACLGSVETHIVCPATLSRSHCASEDEARASQHTASDRGMEEESEVSRGMMHPGRQAAYHVIIVARSVSEGFEKGWLVMEKSERVPRSAFLARHDPLFRLRSRYTPPSCAGIGCDSKSEAIIIQVTYGYPPACQNYHQDLLNKFAFCTGLKDRKLIFQ
jgi:hypothetical protein